MSEAEADDYDALMIPGGVGNPDLLRGDEGPSRSCATSSSQGKPVAVICHGPWLLVETGVVRGRTVTSWPTLRPTSERRREWVDREVVVDGGLVTSRKPDDIPAFNAKMIEKFAEGPHEAQRARVAGWRRRALDERHDRPPRHAAL